MLEGEALDALGHIRARALQKLRWLGAGDDRIHAAACEAECEEDRDGDLDKGGGLHGWRVLPCK